jgi:hypothetical protein
LNVQSLRELAGRADITAGVYQDLVDALGAMPLSVATLRTLLARANITQDQYDDLVRALPGLTPISLGVVVNKAKYYDLLLAALGATGMTAEEARTRARELVAGETVEDNTDLHAKARQIAALVMAESSATGDDAMPAEDIALLKARFGPNVLDDVADTTRMLDLETGLKLEDLVNPALVYEPTGDGEKGMVTRVAASIASPFSGTQFVEELRGGRKLVTYAYTDAQNPVSESFWKAYGRLVGGGTYVEGGSEDTANNMIQGPPLPPLPEVEDPGATASPEETAAYDAYTAAYNMYQESLEEYERNLKEISPADLVGHPLKGLPLNTEMTVVADTETMGTTASDYFWNTLGMFTNSDQIPRLPAGVDPVRDPEIHVPGGTESEATEYYRPIGFEGEGDPSQLSGSFDGVAGHFICTVAETGLSGDLVGLCSITVRPGESGVEYSAGGTWKFVATNSGRNVAERRQDADYLMLGWWVEEPVSATGDIRFGRFFAGSDPYTADQVAGLTGSATYVGPAVGKWATRVEESDTANKGVFSATADLTAVFGDADTVSGQVRDFDIPGFDAVVVLAPTTPGTSNIDGATFSGVTRGEADGRDWSGTWRGAFYGDDRDRERLATPDAVAGYPASVAGLFNASFGCPEADCPAGDDREGQTGFVGVSGVFGAHHTPPAE